MVVSAANSAARKRSRPSSSAARDSRVPDKAPDGMPEGTVLSDGTAQENRNGASRAAKAREYSESFYIWLRDNEERRQQIADAYSREFRGIITPEFSSDPIPIALFEKTCWKMYHSLTTVEFPGPPDVMT